MGPKTKIIWDLHERGVRRTDIAQQLGVSRTYVGQALASVRLRARMGAAGVLAPRKEKPPGPPPGASAPFALPSKNHVCVRCGCRVAGTIAEDQMLPCQSCNKVTYHAHREKPVIVCQELWSLTQSRSPRIPRFINDGGRRKEWVGEGWVDVGPATGNEIELVRPW